MKWSKVSSLGYQKRLLRLLFVNPPQADTYARRGYILKILFSRLQQTTSIAYDFSNKIFIGDVARYSHKFKEWLHE